MELVGWGLLSTVPTPSSLSYESLIKSLGTACFFLPLSAFILRGGGGRGQSVANNLPDERVRI